MKLLLPVLLEKRLLFYKKLHFHPIETDHSCIQRPPVQIWYKRKITTGADTSLSRSLWQWHFEVGVEGRSGRQEAGVSARECAMVGEDMSFRHWSISHEIPWGLKVTWWKSRVRMRHMLRCGGSMNWEEQASACWHLLCGPCTSHWHPLHAPPPRPQSRKHVPTSQTGGAWGWETRLRETKRQRRTVQNNTSETQTGTNQPGTRWDEWTGSPQLINFWIPKVCKFFWTRTLAFQSTHLQPLIQNTWSRMCFAIVTFSH